MNRLHVLTYFALLLLTSNCSLVRFPKIQQIKDFSIIQQSDSFALATVSVDIYNPNSWGFTLKRLEYKAFVNNIYIGSGSVEKTIHFEPKSTSSIDSAQVFIQTPKLDTALKAAGQVDSIPVRFLLKAKLKHIPGHVYWVKTINIDTWQVLYALINWNNVAKFLRLRSIQLTNVTLWHSTLKLKFDFVNPYPIAVDFDTIVLNIYDQHNNFIGSSKTYNIHVRANSITPITFLINIDNLQFAISLAGQYVEQNIKFRITGYLSIKIRGSRFRLPLDQTIESSIEFQ